MFIINTLLSCNFILKICAGEDEVRFKYIYVYVYIPIYNDMVWYENGNGKIVIAIILK